MISSHQFVTPKLLRLLSGKEVKLERVIFLGLAKFEYLLNFKRNFLKNKALNEEILFVSSRANHPLLCVPPCTQAAVQSISILRWTRSSTDFIATIRSYQPFKTFSSIENPPPCNHTSKSTITIEINHRRSKSPRHPTTSAAYN